MKIFWSWQSDTPGNIGRHFVREALEAALSQLNREVTIEDSIRDELHLDHDRKGVPGSPDILATILAKIDDSAIVVADVTPIGRSDVGNDDKKRALMNPNVGIELGYALAMVGEQGLLMVMNRAFGDRDSLPFDLRQKAGPIMYDLAPNSSKPDCQRVHLELVGNLKVAIRECLKGLEASPRTGVHEEVESQINSGQYFDDGTVLHVREDRKDEIELVYKVVPFLYLRVIPTRAMPPLRGPEIKDLVYGIKLLPLRQDGAAGFCWGRNGYGGLTYSFERVAKGGVLETSSQVFANREIWGIDTTLLSRGRHIPSIAFEGVLESGLRHYLQIAKERLELQCPLVIEAGAARVNGYKMAMSPEYVNPYWGPIHKSEIRSRHDLQTYEKREVDRVLLNIFEEFFDAVGERRPEHFRDFPPEDIA